MKFKDRVNKFLLNFDFSKKLIFVLATSIIAALYLFFNIAITEHSLSKIVHAQQKGVGYHQRVMILYQTIIDLLIHLRQSDPENKQLMESKLITMPTFLLAIVDDFKTDLSDYEEDKKDFYKQRLDQIYLDFKNNVQKFPDRKQNDKKFNAQETLIDLKDDLLSLMLMINQNFDLDKSLNNQTGILFEILFYSIPRLQDAVSDLLVIDASNGQELLNAAQFNKHKIQYSINNILAIQNYLNTNYKKKDSLDDKLFESFAMHSVLFSNQLKAQKKELLEKAEWERTSHLSYDIIKESDLLYKKLMEISDKQLKDEDEFYRRKQLLSAILLLSGISLVLTPYLTKAFHSPLSDLKEAVEKFSKGNLSTRIPAINPDEVGEVSKSFNETAKVFEQIMFETDKFANILSQSSSEIFNTAKQLEKNLSNQEENIQDIVLLSKNIVKTAHEFSLPLEQVNTTIQVTADNINLTRDNLSIMESTMQQMVNAAKSTVSALSSIQGEVEKITIVIHTLVIIADQINLLSLNTAIRANKAGVKKFGFSVIAEKIRELADQTAFAALDMEEITQEILSIVPNVIEDIDQFGQEVQGALEDSLVVREQFQKLLTIAQSQISTFQNIQAEMAGQTEKAHEIDRTFDTLIQSTQKTNRAVRNLYIEIEYLYHSTLNLQKATKKFSTD